MDKSTSPAKSVRASQARGAKALSNEKSNKEVSVQREGTKPATTLNSRGNPTEVKDERTIGGQATCGQGKSSTETPQERRRGRPSRLTRLSGRTSSGERGKTRVANSQQQLTPKDPDCRPSVSADSSPSAKRDPSPVVPGTPERGLRDQARSSIPASAQEKSHGWSI